MRGRYSDFLCILSSHTCIASLIINVTHKNGLFFLPRMNLHFYITTDQILQFTSRFTTGVVHTMGLDKGIMTCTHHYKIMQCIFTSLKFLYALSIQPCHFPPNPWQPLIFLIISRVLPFPECHIVGIIQDVAFSDSFISLSNMHLRFIHVF